MKYSPPNGREIGMKDNAETPLLSIVPPSEEIHDDEDSLSPPDYGDLSVSAFDIQAWIKHHTGTKS
tara:strand:- start:1145 stop:1342 length:198 start_codon:yes stop_codon:yes gene_type:complete